jgi:nicotinamidase-related amidase
MGKKITIDRKDAVLAVIDCQEKMIPVMRHHDEFVENCVRFIKGVKAMGTPIVVAQENTKALGGTVEPIAEAIGEFTPVDKDLFDATKQPEFMAQIEKTGKKTVLLIGIQAHICLMLTALSLNEMGYDVFVVSDCIESRFKSDCKEAERRMISAGITMVTAEMALFEMVAGASAPEFGPLNKIVK